MLAKSEVFLACKDQFGLFILRRSQFSDHYSLSVLKDTKSPIKILELYDVFCYQRDSRSCIYFAHQIKYLMMTWSSVLQKRKKSIISALKREGKKTCGLKLDKFTLWNYVGSFSVDNLLLEQLNEVC